MTLKYWQYHRTNQDGADHPLALGSNPFPKWFTPYNNVSDWENDQFGRLQPNEMRVPRINPSQCKFCGHQYRLACVLALLPPKEACERLCCLFFSTVFPLLPILHLLGFAEDFQTFWEERKSSGGHDFEIGVFVRRKPGFVCLLSSMLFAALKCAPKSRLQSILGDYPDLLIAGDMYIVAVISITLTGFPRRPSLYSLAAYLLTQSPFVMEEDFSDFPEFINTAFRVALGMGLHRHLPEAEFNTGDLETRRRLCWYILHLDVMASASSGLSPLLLDDKLANVETISKYDQQEGNSVREGHQSKIQRSNHCYNAGIDSSSVDVRYLVATRRYEVSKKMRYVLRLHFEDALQSAEQVHEIAEQLQTVAEQVSKTIRVLLTPSSSSPSLRRATSSGSSANRSNVESKSFDRVWRLGGEGDDQEALNFCSWSAILLHLMTHKVFCVLYHALFRDPNMVSNAELRTRFQLLVPFSLRSTLTTPAVLSFTPKPSSSSFFESAMILFQSLFIGCIRGLTNLSKLCHCFSQTSSNVHTATRPRSHKVSSMPSLTSIK